MFRVQQMPVFSWMSNDSKLWIIFISNAFLFQKLHYTHHMCWVSDTCAICDKGTLKMVHFGSSDQRSFFCISARFIMNSLILLFYACSQTNCAFQEQVYVMRGHATLELYTDEELNSTKKTWHLTATGWIHLGVSQQGWILMKSHLFKLWTIILQTI